MYRFKRGLLPNYCRNIFTRASHIHSHHISNSSRFSQKGDKRVHTSTRNVALKPMASPSCCHIIPPYPSFHIIYSMCAYLSEAPASSRTVRISVSDGNSS